MTFVLSTNEEVTALAAKLLKLNTSNRSWTMDDEVMHIQIHGKRSAWGEKKWDYYLKWEAELDALENRNRLKEAYLRIAREKVELLRVRYVTDL